MTKQRLQKLIAKAGICSRRKAEELIINKRVELNGQLANIGDKADSDLDEIKIDGNRINLESAHILILINKPIKVITSCHDPQGRKTVLELLPKELRQGIYPIGRLDFESRGALLLTNYGDLALKLSHPRYSHKKTYKVWVKGIPNEKSLYSWRNGLMLDGKITRKAKVNILQTSINKSLLEVVLNEGRNRQIRRIAESLGHPVVDLQRTAISDFKLGGLKEGDWRKLEKDEWNPIIAESKDK